MPFCFNVIIKYPLPSSPCNTNIYRNNAIPMPPEHKAAKIAQCVSYVIILPNVSSGRYYYTNTGIEIISSKRNKYNIYPRFSSYASFKLKCFNTVRLSRNNDLHQK